MEDLEELLFLCSREALNGPPTSDAAVIKANFRQPDFELQDKHLMRPADGGALLALPADGVPCVQLEDVLHNGTTLLFEQCFKLCRAGGGGNT